MTLKPLVVGFSLIAFSGMLHAQQQQQQHKQPQQAQQKQSQQQQQPQQQRGEMQVSRLDGMQAVNAQGQDIGEIGDVVLDLNSGRVHAVVLERGGVLGVGQENFAFPPSEVKPGKQANELIINVSTQAMESRKGFARNQWPGMDADYWGQVGAQSAKGSQAAAGSGAQGKKAEQKAGAKMNLVRGSELVGKQVQDKGGKQVGTVEDVIVALDKGEIRNLHVNLQDGGRAQVPAKAIKMSGTEDRLVLDMDAQQLRSQSRNSGAAGGAQTRSGAATGQTSSGTGASQTGGGTGTAQPR